MVRFLVFNYKRGDEYAFIPLAVPVDVLKLSSVPQILPHASTEGVVISVVRRSEPLSSFGAPSLQHQATILARHSRSKAVRLCSATVIRLEGALGHRNEFSLLTKTVRLIAPCVYVKKRTTDYTDLTVALRVAKNGVSKGDQTVLFYSPTFLDRSETSMLVSARLKGRHPVSN